MRSRLPARPTPRPTGRGRALAGRRDIRPLRHAVRATKGTAMFEPQTLQLMGSCKHLYAQTMIAMGMPVMGTRSVTRILMTEPCAPGACTLKFGRGFTPISARLLAAYECRLDLPAHDCGVTRTQAPFDPADPVARRGFAELVAATVRRHAFALPSLIEADALIDALRRDLGLAR